MKIPVPKQHGAWGMLYVPYLSAVFCFGKFGLPALYALSLITAGFFLQETLLTSIRLYPVRKTSNERLLSTLKWTAVYAGASFVFLIILWNPAILVFCFIAAVIFLLHEKSLHNRADREVFNEFLSVLGLTMSAPFTWYILTGRLDRFGLLLWVLNVLYFTSSIFYVKTRVARIAKKKKNDIAVMRGSAFYHLGIISFLLYATWIEWIPAIVLAAFVPIVVRAFWAIVSVQPKLNLRLLGFTEVGLSLFFLIMLSCGFRA